jgi:sugar/nucleoside kinase (ribokinase family)
VTAPNEASARQPLPVPDVVVVGAACRDLRPSDAAKPGWRLGGAVPYAALTLARLGIRTGAVMGVDAEAARAAELDLLRVDGVDLHLVPLDRGAIFQNVETPEGRAQSAFERSDLVPPEALPVRWRAAAWWVFAPVAAELADDWAAAVPADARVALGWQGLLRALVPGERVRHVPPRASSLVARAELVVVGADDLGRDVDLPAVGRLLSPGTTLVLTRGAAGGIVFVADVGGLRPVRRFPSIPTEARDPTGAGDIFLAALVAAAIGTPAPDGAVAIPEHLRFAATVAAVSVTGFGLNAVPEGSAIRRRLAADLGARLG